MKLTPSILSLCLLCTALVAQRDRPCLIAWQRNLDDALALVAATGRPLLICVNMDGEAACDRLASGRYRDPEFARWTRGFVAVLASPDRHGARDHDDRGRRLPDEKFGRVTSQEHIDIEPLLFDRYFNGRRVAPRHIGVSASGEILFDIFLTNDLGDIDRALQEHGVPPAVEIGEKAAPSELLASPDAGQRDRLESLFMAAESGVRAEFASEALSATRAVQHPEIIRLALRDPDPAVRAAAVDSIAAQPQSLPVSLWPQALFVTSGERGRTAALIDALQVVANADGESPALRRARLLQRAQVGLASSSSIIDVVAFTAAAQGDIEPLPLSEDQFEQLDSQLDALEQRLRAAPGDRAAHVRVAELSMHYALIQMATGSDPSFLLQDARNAARLAYGEVNTEARARGYAAWASYLLGEPQVGLRDAVLALPKLASEGGTVLGFSLLDATAKMRTQALYAEMNTLQEWPATWIADLRAAHEVLLAHPLASDEQALAYVQWLGVMEAYGLQEEVLRRALHRYPTSAGLHEELRLQQLRDRGARGLERAYADLASASEGGALLAWYTGLAMLYAAEREVENRDDTSALRAYGSCIGHFGDAKTEPQFADSAAHYLALAHGGRARLLAAAADWQAAADAAIAAVEARAESLDVQDGLGRTPKQSARSVYRALRAADQAAVADQLAAVLDQRGIDLPRR